MTRITNADIEHYENMLNKACNLPIKSWIDGKAQIGNLHVQGMNGHFNIYQHVNEGGGASALAEGLTKREAYDWLKAACKGIELVFSADRFILAAY